MDARAVDIALSNPVRRKIIACLGSRTKTVSDLCAACTLSQSAVSQHLMKLRLSGAVTSTKSGRERLYRVADRRLASICRTITNLTP